MGTKNVCAGSRARRGGGRFRYLDQRTERVERRRDIAGLLGDDDEMIVLLVFGERDPEAIENSPAHRRYQPQADAVLVREDRVTLRVHDLQLVHPPADGGEKQCLTAGEDRRAPGEQLLAKHIPPHCGQSAPMSAR